MTEGAKIEGFEKVMANLHKEVARIEGVTVGGLQLAAAKIRVDMDRTEPLIPVDKGNLRASWFVSSFRTLKGPGVVMGFSANYAAWVHEMVGAHFRKKGAGAKFFEASIKRNEKAVLEIIRNNAKIR